MPRSVLILLVVLVLVVVALFVLHGLAHEVPQTLVEKPVPDAALAH